MTLPGTRGASGFSIATSRAIGWPFLAITISSPAAARSTSEERLVFASYRFTWAISALPAILPAMEDGGTALVVQVGQEVCRPSGGRHRHLPRGSVRERGGRYGERLVVGVSLNKKK